MSDDYLSPAEIERLKKLLGNPMDYSPELKAYLKDWVETNIGAYLPLAFLGGSGRLSAQVKNLGNLGSSNPPVGAGYDGGGSADKFITVDGPCRAIIFWFGSSFAPADDMLISISVNGAGASDDDALRFRNTDRRALGFRAKLITLPLEANTVMFRFRKIGSGPADAFDLVMGALRTTV